MFLPTELLYLQRFQSNHFMANANLLPSVMDQGTFFLPAQGRVSSKIANDILSLRQVDILWIES